MGTWGNANIEAPYESLEVRAYIVGLIRQSFEKQMGNGEADA